MHSDSVFGIDIVLFTMQKIREFIRKILRFILSHSSFVQDLLLPTIPRIPEGSDLQISFSQYGQDLFLRKLIRFLPEKKRFTFVDIGAHDGVTFSNSFFLENLENWDGICVEANADVFPKLAENRKKSECINVAVSDTSGFELFFKNDGYSEMLSGLASRMPRKHKKRTIREQEQYLGKTNEVFVETVTLNEICVFRGLTEIDLLLIDVEGAEKAILNSIDFDNLHINIICVERNWSSDGVLATLVAAGFLRLLQIGADDIYVHSTILINGQN